jgi:hypothetical protein
VPVNVALVPFAVSAGDGQPALAVATDLVLELNPLGPVSVVTGFPTDQTAPPTTELAGLLRTLGRPGNYATGDFSSVVARAARSLPSTPTSANAVVVVLPEASAATVRSSDLLAALQPRPGTPPVPLYVLTSGALPASVDQAVAASGGRILRTTGGALSSGVGELGADLTHWFSVSYTSSIRPARLSVSVSLAGEERTMPWSAPVVDATQARTEAHHRRSYLPFGVAAAASATVLLLGVGRYRRRKGWKTPADDPRGFGTASLWDESIQPARPRTTTTITVSATGSVAAAFAELPVAAERQDLEPLVAAERPDLVLPVAVERPDLGPPVLPTLSWEEPPVLTAGTPAPALDNGYDEPPLPVVGTTSEPPLPTADQGHEPRLGSGVEPELPGVHQPPHLPAAREAYEGIGDDPRWTTAQPWAVPRRLSDPDRKPSANVLGRR